MAKVFFRNFNRSEADIRRAVDFRMTKVFQQGPLLIKQQAEILRNAFSKSPEYQNIKTKMVGQFGFTPAEVSSLDRILTLLVPGSHDITISEIKASPGRPKTMLLRWVNLEKLIDHPFAQHELTKLDSLGTVIEVTDIISWVEWLEFGETFTGFTFSRVNQVNALRSRSGLGIMREQPGNTFIIEPTTIFHKIGFLGAGDSGLNIIKKGFGILVKRAIK